MFSLSFYTMYIILLLFLVWEPTLIVIIYCTFVIFRICIVTIYRNFSTTYFFKLNENLFSNHPVIGIFSIVSLPRNSFSPFAKIFIPMSSTLVFIIIFVYVLWWWLSSASYVCNKFSLIRRTI